ncbi:MAG: DNA polymerase IV [Geminicoccaceae bacterium]
MRKIIHIDMDAFFAAVEQRDHPGLRGKPIAVGGSSERGVVMTASYEARPYGVRSAMPSVVARRRCPDLIFVRARMDAYREVSQQIRAIFRQYTDLFEPLSLDEAYLDVTEPKRGDGSATQIAKAIKADILQATRLSASAGVSFNKFLAKIASDMNKPDGLTVIRPAQADAFIAALPIEKFHGVGPVTARKMHEVGIRTGADLRSFSEAELALRFGKAGGHYYRIARGIDDRTVQPSRLRKSIGAERTFETDIADPADMVERLRPIADKLAERMAASESFGRTVTLKIKHRDFTIQTRSRSHDRPVTSAEALMRDAQDLLYHPHAPHLPVRLLGLSISNFDQHNERLSIQLELDV